MRRFVTVNLFFFLCVSCVLALSVRGQDSGPTEGGHEAKPERVILHVNRNLDVAGTLALEDDDVIAVRTAKGEVESFPKSRVMQIVRLVDPEPGQTGIVVLRDGGVREGIIIEDAFDYVLVDIQGIRAKLKRDVVSHVVLQPTFEQRYAETKASIRPGMYDAHFALCKWLFGERKYELAKRELDELLEQVEMPEARKLLNLVEAQLALAEKPASSGSAKARENKSPGTDDPDLVLPSEPSRLSLPDNIISKADVNLIRVYEIDFEAPPKVSISPDTVRAIIEKYGANKLVPASQAGRNAMFSAAADRPLEIVRLLFDLRARDLYAQIQVNSEPPSLNLFRQRVHDTWLMNNCATSRCHGGPDAGKFFLYRKNYKDERVRYTNFLILERLQLDPQWPLINYQKPEDSLILQYGLSRDDPICRKPHPRVPGWKPAFSPINQTMKQDAVDWIRSMMQPRPEYPVQFEPPQLVQPRPGGTNDGEPPQPDR